ncbi:unnamed protein product [Strongylus vulgaris]|uniref:Uncharacterized protein n=1 Tax=Strongylus vulgaris TaxID=40348 RepID=A0A3P7IRJ3_STRVU|nr:unnamed protein product [Strongylus vulgaris]
MIRFYAGAKEVRKVGTFIIGLFSRLNFLSLVKSSLSSRQMLVYTYSISSSGSQGAFMTMTFVLYLQRKDPDQFMQIHGRKCTIHTDKSIARAAEDVNILLVHIYVVVFGYL